jgi:hypothetical protein
LSDKLVDEVLVITPNVEDEKFESGVANWGRFKALKNRRYPEFSKTRMRQKLESMPQSSREADFEGVVPRTPF